MENTITRTIKSVEHCKINEGVMLTLENGEQIGINAEEFCKKFLVKQPIKTIEGKDYFIFDKKIIEFWTY